LTRTDDGNKDDGGFRSLAGPEEGPFRRALRARPSTTWGRGWWRIDGVLLAVVVKAVAAAVRSGKLCIRRCPVIGQSLRALIADRRETKGMKR
jgi:hypothetical protein